MFKVSDQASSNKAHIMQSGAKSKGRRDGASDDRTHPLFIVYNEVDSIVSAHNYRSSGQPLDFDRIHTEFWHSSVLQPYRDLLPDNLIRAVIRARIALDGLSDTPSLDEERAALRTILDSIATGVGITGDVPFVGVIEAQTGRGKSVMFLTIAIALIVEAFESRSRDVPQFVIALPSHKAIAEVEDRIRDIVAKLRETRPGLIEPRVGKWLAHGTEIDEKPLCYRPKEQAKLREDGRTSHKLCADVTKPKGSTEFIQHSACEYATKCEIAKQYGLGAVGTLAKPPVYDIILMTHAMLLQGATRFADKILRPNRMLWVDEAFSSLHVPHEPIPISLLKKLAPSFAAAIESWDISKEERFTKRRRHELPFDPKTHSRIALEELSATIDALEAEIRARKDAPITTYRAIADLRESESEARAESDQVASYPAAAK